MYLNTRRYAIRGATRDHEPRRGEGSALPIRRRLAATWLETSSRRCRRVPAAHSGFFAAPGHERRLRGTRNLTNGKNRPPSHLPTFSPSVREAREAGVFVCGEGRLSCPTAGRDPKGGDGDFTAAEATPRSRPWNRRRQSPTGDSSCRRVRGRAQRKPQR